MSTWVGTFALIVGLGHDGNKPLAIRDWSRANAEVLRKAERGAIANTDATAQEFGVHVLGVVVLDAEIVRG